MAKKYIAIHFQSIREMYNFLLMPVLIRMFL